MPPDGGMSIVRKLKVPFGTVTLKRASADARKCTVIPMGCTIVACGWGASLGCMPPAKGVHACVAAFHEVPSIELSLVKWCPTSFSILPLEIVMLPSHE